MGSVYAASVCEMIAHFRVEIYQECAYGLRMLELSRRREYHVRTIVCDKSVRTHSEGLSCSSEHTDAVPKSFHVLCS
jgi:hypothetical protein